MSAADMWADDQVEVRRIHPFEAVKRYLCPGCQHDIEVGVGHIVAVPKDDPGGRRHWHLGCWSNRHRRRPGRTGR